MSLSRVIVKFVMAGVMVSLPEFLKMSTDMLAVPQTIEAAPGTMGALAVNMSASMAQMANLLGIMGYIIGIGFAITALMELKQYAERGGFDSCEPSKKVEPLKTEVKVNLEKKEEESKVESILVDLKKRAQENIDVAINKEEPLDFKNSELNALVKDILEKVKYLKDHGYIKKDMESQLMVEKTESEYLYKIHRNYMDIPEYKRGKKGMENSPYDLTSKQLKLIISGLDEIENRIVNESIMKQKANEIFLKEKVASM